MVRSALMLLLDDIRRQYLPRPRYRMTRADDQIS